VFLGSPGAVDEDVFHVSLVSFGSNIIKRVVRSTIQAESYNMQAVVEEADLVRAAVVDCHGLLDRKAWETSASDNMRSVWITDCQSLKSALARPVVKTIDKRLGIELASLRQQLWRFPGRSSLEARLQDEPPPTPTDILRWVDTHVMATDPLTKIMKDTYLQDILDSGVWDITQPEIGKRQKESKQAYRHQKRLIKNSVSDANEQDDGELE